MDIKKVLSALSEDDRNTWQSCRNALRSAYINAHNNIIGVQDWSIEDDAFLDLIDIKIATLFDRAGRLETTEKIIPSGEAIEKDIEKAVEEIGRVEKAEPNEALKKLMTTPSPWEKAAE